MHDFAFLIQVCSPPGFCLRDRTTPAVISSPEVLSAPVRKGGLFLAAGDPHAPELGRGIEPWASRPKSLALPPPSSFFRVFSSFVLLTSHFPTQVTHHPPPAFAITSHS